MKTGKIYENDWLIVAICYDFDKTLSPDDMQNFGLIPKLNCTVGKFWGESNALAEKYGMDKILAYMHLIIEKAKTNRVKVAEEDFLQLGKEIRLFPGVDSWFERINAIARDMQINLEHYIISAGLKEIIRGTSIAKYFTEIYASSFVYDEYGAPIWPRQVVNYTTKTQYLFRISKNCLDLSDEKSVNAYKKDEERRIPFANFIYIGDSETDIPAMKIVKNGGGTSIGVYNFETVNISEVAKLLRQERIDYLVPALYGKDTRLEILVKDVLKKIRAKEALKRLHNRQIDYIDLILELDSIVEVAGDLLKRDLSAKERADFEIRLDQIFGEYRARLTLEYGSLISEEEIERIINEKKEKLKQIMDEKKEKHKRSSRR